MTKKIFFIIAFCVCINNYAQTTHTIDEPKDIESLTLNPGDTVVLKDGEYDTDERIDFVGYGTSVDPITFRPETPGGVVFTGGMQMNVAGDYLVIDGFYWNGGYGASNFIQFRNGTDYAQNCTIQNCAINNLQIHPDDLADDVLEGSITKHRWIVLYGNYNNVLNCSFMNKASAGALILVELAYNASPYGTDLNTRCDIVGHTISNNYFYNYEKMDSSLSNSGDSETIRVGTSEYQNVDCRTTVSNNYFVEADGENEIITNKSANNIYTNNTFRRCRGSLVLRHGAGATVDKNYFLGENVDGTGGIRIVDSNHTITNNYIQDCVTILDQAKWNNGFTFMGGGDSSVADCNSESTSNGYQKSESIIVSNNTIINTNEPLFYNGDKGTNSNTGTVSNNLIYFESGNNNLSEVIGEDDLGDYAAFGETLTYTGNVFGGTSLGEVNAGFSAETISLTASGEVFVHDQVGKGADMGSFEPHTDAMVGNGIGACFLDFEATYIASPICTIVQIDNLNVSPLTEFSTDGGSQTVSVNTNVAWEATESLDWVTISPTSGTGEGGETIMVTVTENPDTTPRSGVISFSQVGGDLTASLNVNQAAPDLTDLYTLINTGDENDPVTVESYSSYEVAKGSAPSQLLDKNSETKWTASDGATGDGMGDGEFAIYDLGAVYSLDLIQFSTDSKSDPYGYQIWVSEDGVTDEDFTKVIPESGELAFSQAGTTDFQALELDIEARYVKLIGFGRYSVIDESNYTQTSEWVNFTEIEFFGESDSLSTDKVSLAGALVYPIPADDKITLANFDNLTNIEVLSVTGKVLSSQNVKTASDFSLDTSGLANGIYLLKLSNTAGDISSQKIVIQH